MSETRISSLLGKITVLLIICCLTIPAQAKYGGGSGEPNDPYLIYTAEQMNAIGADSNDWHRRFKLMADIDLSAYTGESFNIIGTDYHNTFTGVFDGNGHTISYFSYTSTGRNYIGIFGYLRDSDAEIKNLGLIAPNVDAGSGKLVGSLVGTLHGTITNCYVKGGSVSGRYYTGGLVGMNYGTITNCYTSGSITGDKYLGGLVGESFSGTINNCYTTGSVSGRYTIGGLSGNNAGTMINSYSTADVTGDDTVGGLTGYNHNTIKYCYSTGTVFGNLAVGGLVGSNYGAVLGCFWDIQTSGRDTSSGGTPKTTDQMMDLNTFLYWGVCANQDVWTINDGNDYPRLAWQNLPGVLIVTSGPVYGGGSGSEADPYQIWTADQLNKIGLIPCHWDKHFMLMADIDLSGVTGSEFNIIGFDYYNPFSGVFEGKGHTISNFTYTSTGRNNTGLFGYVSGIGAEIKNLGLIDPNVYVETRFDVGSFVGQLEVGTLSNCYVEGGSVSGEYRVGGLVGRNNGTITDCYAKTSVFGDYLVGGLVGYNENSIVDCYTLGNVMGGDNSSYVGGLCGKSAGPHHGAGQSRIQNCFSKANVTGNSSVGGLIGHNGRTVINCYSTGSVIGGDYSLGIGGLIGNNGGHGSIKNCYSIGSVEGDEQVGGLVGNNEGTVVASYWDIETSGKTTSNGGIGLTTAEMQVAGTFVCWGYEPVWTIDEGIDYPRLVWENKPGELITVPSDLYGGGSGEPEDPYLIYTAEQLNMIGLYSCHWDKHFLLCEDIDLGEFTGTSFNIIGIDHRSPFSGVFDGNGRKIFNFTYTSTGIYGIGLFGWVSGVIKDLGLIDPNVDAGTGYYVGSMVGSLNDGTITNCYIEGGSVDGRNYIGGLVGSDSRGTISNSYSTCIVSGYWYVGGLVGYNSSRGTIINSCSTGSVSGYRYVGGLVGRNRNGTITYCYTAGDVSSEHAYTGGLVGYNLNNGTITNCYSTGSVTGKTNVGGLVGESEVGTIINSYSTATVFGHKSIGGLVGRNASTITNSFSTAGVSGTSGNVGGLVGENGADITNSYSNASVSGRGGNVGGLVGVNSSWNATITNSYSAGSVAGWDRAGGLVGGNFRGTITNCYARNKVSGNERVGGLVGYNYYGKIIASFWDIETGGPYNGIGTPLPTEQMQMASTFTDAGWDFVGETVNGIDDIWFIPQGHYPHLWWQGMQVPLKLTPRKLNCRSEGNWVKARLTMPEGFTVSDVDSDKPAVLHSFGLQSYPLYVFVNKDKLVEIEAAFEREALCSLAGDWPRTLTVAGFLTDGNIFLGNSTVKIIHPGMKVIEDLANYWLNEDCVHPDFCDGIDVNRDSLVNLPDYALLMNTNVEFVTDE